MKRVMLAMGFYDRGFRRGVMSYASSVGWSLDSSTSIAPVVPRNKVWDGIVWLHAPYSERLNSYLATVPECPIIHVDPDQRSPEMSVTLTDHRATGHQAAEYLIEQGYPNIAFCGGSEVYMDSIMRGKGVEETCKIMGVPFHTLDRGKEQNIPWDEALTDSLLALPKPLGICAVNDQIADIVVRAAVRLGLEIPGEVAIIGAENDEDLCELGHLGITSIEGNTFNHAQIACEMLDGWMESGTPPTPRQVVVGPGEVIERESTGFPKTKNHQINKALRMIEHGYSDPCLTADSIIETLSLKKSAAYTLFQRECGTSISKFITKRRLRRAQLLLVSTELALGDVSKQAGFGNARQLTDVFKRVLGQTPTQYRAKRSSALIGDQHKRYAS